MKKLLLGIFVLIPFLIIGQEYIFQNFKLNPEPLRIKLTPEEEKEPYVILKEARILEFVYDEQKQLIKYEGRHRLVRLNDSRAISGFNKVYIPTYDVIEVVEIKARSISRDGKITEINKDNIKEIDNYKGYGSYQIFAIDGLEEGSEIEYYYILKKEASFYDRYFYQTGGLVKNASFQLISPKHLVFIAKGYNGFPQPFVRVVGDKRILASFIDSIPALKKGKYVFYDANLMRIDYKFRHNELGNKNETLDWDNIANNLYSIFYKSNPKAEKLIGKILSGLKLKDLSEEEKIIRIENYIKTNFVVKSKAKDKHVLEIDFILQYGYSNDEGIVRLFVKFLDKAGIEHLVVITSARNKVRFDKDFMSYKYLEEFLIYFPKQNQFLAPSKSYYRYGLIPGVLSDNYGLFIIPVTTDDTKKAIAELKFIPAIPCKESYDYLKVFVNFTDAMDEVIIKTTRSWSGHAAMFIQPYYEYFSEEDKSEVLENLLKSVGNDAKIIRTEVLNSAIGTSALKDHFIIDAELTIKSLLEVAGDDYLFKVGDLIGGQVQMYKPKNRQCPAEMEFPHGYLRELSISIPEGYYVKGLERLKMKIAYGDGEKYTMAFISDYVIEDDILKVTIEEYYTETIYPLEQFEKYREVINAAADFNKIAIIFEKKATE